MEKLGHSQEKKVFPVKTTRLHQKAQLISFRWNFLRSFYLPVAAEPTEAAVTVKLQCNNIRRIMMIKAQGGNCLKVSTKMVVISIPGS